MSDVSCLSCGHQSSIEGELADGIYSCTECKARIVYGTLAPRLVVEPDLSIPTQPMLVVRIQHPVTKEDMHMLRLDPQFAASLAKNILNLVIP